MGREILFRGKKRNNGKWIYGVPVSNEYITCIFTLVNGLNELKGFEVVPETVGQYTGLHDKNGRKIFEGDIVAYEYLSDEGKKTEYYAVRYQLYKWVFTNYQGISDDGGGWVKTTYVAGNLHDNPELLKGE